MFRTEPMAKIRLICLQSDLEHVIEIFHKSGVVELRKSKLELKEEQQSELSNKLNELLVKVEGAVSILSFLDKKKNKKENFSINKIKHMSLSELSKKITTDQSIAEIYSLSQKEKDIEDEIKLLNYAKETAQKFFNIKVNFSKLKSDILSIKAFELETKNFKKASKKLKKETKNKEVEILSCKNGKKTSLIVAAPKTISIDDLLKEFDAVELDLSSKYLSGTPVQIINYSKKQINTLTNTISSIKQRLTLIKKHSLVKLMSYKEMLSIELSRANASLIFKKTDSTAVIEGWIPKKKEQLLKTQVEKTLKNNVFIESFKDDELAPTLINHPKFLRSFDYMIEFFSLPRSDEINPSLIFIISFPIFYGLMISDVGYGIMSLILSTIIKKKTDPNGLMYNTATLWQLNSISAMFFGFLSNQYLGMPFNQYFTSFQGINWFSDISYIAVISIVFGLIQVLLGLVFGFINEYHHHKKKLAFAKLTSFSLVLFGTFAIAGGLFGALPYNITLISTVVAIISLIATLVLSGERALEVIDLISHTLSYMRIMGFGLASVIIAFLIDFAFTPKLSDGVVIFIIYLVIFLLLHVLNMIVSIFEGLVQGLRLNFVEFFTKFYEGGGIKFKPFSYKRVYTKE